MPRTRLTLKLVPLGLLVVGFVVESVACAAEQIDVADGLTATVFATPERIANPASIDVDDRGRVWVVETVNYRKKTREEGDRILMLEDRDGDGRSEKPLVFFQGHEVDGGHGICVLDRQVIVSVSDRILVFTDADGDDRADHCPPFHF